MKSEGEYVNTGADSLNRRFCRMAIRRGWAGRRAIGRVWLWLLRRFWRLRSPNIAQIRRIEAALDAADERTRQVVVLFYVHELKAELIAEVLKIPLRDVMVARRAFRARAGG